MANSEAYISLEEMFSAFDTNEINSIPTKSKVIKLFTFNLKYRNNELSANARQIKIALEPIKVIVVSMTRSNSIVFLIIR